MNTENIKLFVNKYSFIDKEDCDFMISWIDKNCYNKDLFSTRVGIAYNEGQAFRAVFPDAKPATLFKELKPWVDKYSEKFKKILKEQYDEENLYYYGISITKLTAGIQLRIHNDVHNDHSTLTYSCVALLNDNYAGGEMVFVNNDTDLSFDQENINFPLKKHWMDSFVLKPEAGGAVFFKADQLHAGEKITEGERYAVILWTVKEKENEFKGFDSDFVHTTID